ncbi:serine hydrolase [Streptomyces sp. AK02-01A]|uniref:serine hydrolase n=1 Tax=Streptomyces sp. AK02-01A TaxID=3028648 RepID=UPI0029ABBFFF|nr:serine hydrolase [Streptomyces sp. AK02-01A]MDX3850452.1 serine hydrolase [Streptomyces sp. AK02-01A]
MDLSFAVYDTAGGRETAYGEDRTYVTASVVKVAILAALLLRAADSGRWLTGEEERLAEAMIERSDNDAATALRAAAGGPAGLDAAHARLGMTRTSAASAWGLTRTTARDQLTLLKAVFGTDSPLDGRARGFLAGLMGRVVAGQDWGVSAAGDDWALKNGWLPRSGSGLWVVHSVGRVRGCLVAVLSDGHGTREEGIARVEEAAVRAVRRVVRLPA